MSPLSPLYHLFVVMQDVTFHQCVNLGKFNTEKVVSFVPPDGEFELMKYRCQEGIKQPFKVCTPSKKATGQAALPLASHCGDEMCDCRPARAAR